MKKYVIERAMSGVGAMNRDQLHAAATASCRALAELGADVQWVHSYVTADRIYCVYLAENEEIVRRHAERAGCPADRIAAVCAMIDPTMGAATAPRA